MFWVKILNFFDVYPGSGLEKFRSGMRDGNMPDPQHWLDMYQAGPGAAGEEEAGGGAGGGGGGRHHRPRHGGRLEKRGRNPIVAASLISCTVFG
jgi:hypothetical protein